ncbi:MAG: UbiA family prenyltransferase, partial [Pseudonocardiaceae bacterium]
MTSELERPAAAVRRAKMRAYARLAKLDVFDYYLSALVVWTLLAPAARLDGQNLLTLAIFLLSEVCLIAALVAFDDVTG